MNIDEYASPDATGVAKLIRTSQVSSEEAHRVAVEAIRQGAAEDQRVCCRTMGEARIQSRLNRAATAVLGRILVRLRQLSMFDVRMPPAATVTP